MSDYLSTLAARSLSLVPVATPRLTSWFEPASPAGGTMALPTAPDMVPPPHQPPRVTAMPIAGDVPRRRETSPPATTMHAASHAHASRAGDEAVDGSRAHGIRVTADRAAQVLPGTDAAAPAHAAQPPGIVPAAKAPRSDSALVPSTAPEPKGESDARIGPRAPQTPRLSDIVRRATEDRLTALERSRAREVVRAQPAADPREPTSPAVRPPAGREPSAVKPAVRVASDTLDSDTQAPAVRITIGRIEVRAVMPQPPAPLPKPVPPSSSSAISLDEYLKQRSGAGR